MNVLKVIYEGQTKKFTLFLIASLGISLISFLLFTVISQSFLIGGIVSGWSFIIYFFAFLTGVDLTIKDGHGPNIM